MVFFITFSCGLFDDENERYENEAHLKGTILYFIDTLTWVGGECDPSGFIFDNYTWLIGEPDYEHYRVYLGSEIDSTYLNKNAEIGGDLKSISAGGVVTVLRKFPMIVVMNIETGI